MMPKTVILGANGQLGSDLCRVWQEAGQPYIPLRRPDLDVRDADAVQRVLSTIQPAVVINTTAFHKVELCQEDPELAFSVNAFAVRMLAKVCRQLQIRLVHFSTDYVFSGDSPEPYAENAVPAPVNAYGWSKATGEYFVREECPDHLLIRTSGLFGIAGASGKGGNFVETMLRRGRETGAVSVVTDQRLSPTYTRDLASMVLTLVDAAATGTFHVTSAGSCTWHEFARLIFAQAGLSVEVQPVRTESSGARVRRPASSVLANTRLAREGHGLLRRLPDALDAYLTERTGDRSSMTSPVAIVGAGVR